MEVKWSELKLFYTFWQEKEHSNNRTDVFLRCPTCWTSCQCFRGKAVGPIFHDGQCSWNRLRRIEMTRLFPRLLVYHFLEQQLGITTTFKKRRVKEKDLMIISINWWIFVFYPYLLKRILLFPKWKILSSERIFLHTLDWNFN